MKPFALLALILSTTAFASDAQHFGDRGELALTNDFQASLGYLSYGGSGAFAMNLSPAADYFLSHQISLGAQVGFTLLTGSGETGANFSFAPRVGIAVPVSPTVTFWPKMGVQVTTGDFVAGALVVPNSSQTTFGITFDLPVLLHLTDHFFVGAGPKVLAQVVGDLKQTSVALAFTLGGWL